MPVENMPREHFSGALSGAGDQRPGRKSRVNAGLAREFSEEFPDSTVQHRVWVPILIWCARITDANWSASCTSLIWKVVIVQSSSQGNYEPISKEIHANKLNHLPDSTHWLAMDPDGWFPQEKFYANFCSCHSSESFWRLSPQVQIHRSTETEWVVRNWILWSQIRKALSMVSCSIHARGEKNLKSLTTVRIFCCVCPEPRSFLLAKDWKFRLPVFWPKHETWPPGPTYFCQDPPLMQDHCETSVFPVRTSQNGFCRIRTVGWRSDGDESIKALWAADKLWQPRVIQSLWRDSQQHPPVMQTNHAATMRGHGRGQGACDPTTVVSSPPHIKISSDCAFGHIESPPVKNIPVGRGIQYARLGYSGTLSIWCEYFESQKVV